MNSFLEINTSFISNVEDIAICDNTILSQTLNQQQALKARLLTDPSRLPEIYNLRLNVWEHSGQSEFVNRKLYPNGWHDYLDKTAFHWVVFNKQNRIIASARLNLFYSLEDFPYCLSVKKFLLPAAIPFAFFSRLVVDPQYRQNGLSRQLFTGRSLFCEERQTRWSQVFINNPIIINQFEKSGYNNIGKTDVAYHSSSEPHSVNVLVKENNYLVQRISLGDLANYLGITQVSLSRIRAKKQF